MRWPRVRFTVRRMMVVPGTVVITILGVCIWLACSVSDLPARSILKGPAEPIWGLSYSPDGKVLAAADSSGVTLLEATNGGIRKSFSFPQQFASLAFSPDGRTIIVAGWGGDATAWDVGSGRRISTLSNTSDPLALRFTPDGRTLDLIRSRPKSGEVEITGWGTATWGEQSRIALPVKGVCSIYSAALSADGVTLALATKGNGSLITLWDTSMGQPRGVLRPSAKARTPSVCSIAFRPDGRSLVAGGEDGSIQVWDLATGRSQAPLQGHAGGVMPGRLVFTPDGRALISAGTGWPPRPDPPLIPLTPLPFGIGRLLGSARGSSALRQEFIVWELDRGMRARIYLELPGPLANGIGPTSAFAIAPDGRTLATSHADGSVRLRDLKTD
jgi:WD40 repeat protein